MYVNEASHLHVTGSTQQVQTTDASIVQGV